MKRKICIAVLTMVTLTGSNMRTLPAYAASNDTSFNNEYGLQEDVQTVDQMEDLGDFVVEEIKTVETTEEEPDDIGFEEDPNLDEQIAFDDRPTFWLTNRSYRFGTNKQVTFLKDRKGNAKVAVVPSEIIYKNRRYRVTVVNKNAFLKRNVSKITLGKNVEKIGSSAFQGSKVKEITIQSRKLKKLSKNAFAGLSKKVTIHCPKAKVKEYTKLFRNAGLNKNVKIKGI